MSTFLLTERARDDVERLVHRLAGAGPRAARRALDELFASMHWLAGEDGRGAPGDALELGEPVRLWLVRDVLLVWRPAQAPARAQAHPRAQPRGADGGGSQAVARGEAEGEAPAVLLRVLRRVPASG
jgi:plasmid stabilization system protein ParE